VTEDCAIWTGSAMRAEDRGHGSEAKSVEAAIMSAMRRVSSDLTTLLHRRPSRGDVAWCAIVAWAYIAAAVIAARHFVPAPDRMMVLAERIAQGHLDSPSFFGTVDSVTDLGRAYMTVEPLLPVVYLPFVALASLRADSSYIISVGLGILTAWLALPLARAYGASGRVAYWVAGMTAFGTLLFYVSVFGDFYYTAHVEAFVLLALFLLEWAGPRRAVVLGLLLAMSALARTPTVLAAVPFGLALIWRRPDWLRRGLAFGAPMAAAVAVYAAYNWARFGSPTETGYALSRLASEALVARRAIGLFSISQVPENIRLALLAGFTIRGTSPFLVPSPSGLSMLLVSPGLLISLRAGIRSSGTWVLWAAAALVAIPIFLYYGGGYVQYGFRYSLDFTPFLVALVAIGASRRFGLLERLLIVASAVSVTYGVLWHAHVVKV